MPGTEIHKMCEAGDIFSIVLVCLALFCLVNGQQPEVFCQEACAVGFTCAMVQEGSGEPKPGCINRFEAELLAKALQEQSNGPLPPAPASQGAVAPSVSPPSGVETAVHSHDTSHGIVTHRHDIPVQPSLTNNSPVTAPGLASVNNNIPNTLPGQTSVNNPGPVVQPQPTPLTRPINMFPGARDPVRSPFLPGFSQFPFRQSIPARLDRFAMGIPGLRFFHRGRFIPLTSFPSEFMRSPGRPRDGFPGARFSGADTRHNTPGMSQPSARFTGVSTDRRTQNRPALALSGVARRHNHSVDYASWGPGGGGRCHNCNSHLECLPSEYCARSDFCSGAVVCQLY